MPKTILGPAEPIKNPAWPYSLRDELPEGHDRALYDTSRPLICYRNAGQFPKGRDPFPGKQWTRPSRRAAGQRRNRHLGTYPTRSAVRTKTIEQADAERALRLARRRIERAELQIMPVAQ